MKIQKCKKCGFILGTRPNLRDENGICLACANMAQKKKINWKERQDWLTDYLKHRINKHGKYDVAVGVSGGKDSTSIVGRLIKEHDVPSERILLIHVVDEFTVSEAGRYNLDNIVKTFNTDIIDFRYSPQQFVAETKKDFFEELHPLKWIERQIYNTPIEVARSFGIPTLFMGENSAFEYGEDTNCSIFHEASTDNLNIVFMGSIWPYSTQDSLLYAKKHGLRTLDDYDDWIRQGCGDMYSQIDSYGYIIHLWTKFIKFGFQRVSDIACRHVREGILTIEQAEQLIADEDWRCDPLAKRDFCRTIGIEEADFNNTVDRFANRDLLVKDANGNWRRKDLL